MLLGMSTAALADDGQEKAEITVTVQAATYTVSVPDDVTFNLADVVVPDDAADGGDCNVGNFRNMIGCVLVSGVENCAYINCRASATPLAIGTAGTTEYTELAYFIETVCYEALPVVESGVYDRLGADGYVDLAVYYKGRVMDTGEELVDRENVTADFLMCVPEESAEPAAPGSYRCMLTFEFTSSRVAP